ncbi:hypothetical protein EMCG_01448 [[Emmonsia] crescens]|uniref:Uncharacterized protein n=1 Tax=[Emmonsia] crescens TaxID=73230 RepID=A0A0G2J2M0_9EURO|nr:hypothetical protein EMCG_01448 [Emmonsia crescens UAMH 3008]
MPSPEDACLVVDGKILYKQTVVPVPQIETPPNITTEIQYSQGADLEAEYAARLIPVQVEVGSGVGEQPYDEKSLEGACNHIPNALGWLERNQHVLRENMVGTVLVGAIENYTERRSPPEGAAAVDYGIVAVYNATVCKLAVAISRGVTVPQAYFKEAEGKCGKVTVGRILAQNFGLDAANWHEVVLWHVTICTS